MERESILNDYLYSGLSFLTYKFDKLSFLSCKYELAKFNFSKKRILRLMHFILTGRKEKNGYFQLEKYLAKNNINALKSSNILLSMNPVEIKMYLKIRNKRTDLITDKFRMDDLPLGFNNKKACLFINNSKDIEKYRFLSAYFKSLNVIAMDKLEQNDTIWDQLNQAILHDNESEVYFVGEGIYANYFAYTAYSRDKIVIHL